MKHSSLLFFGLLLSFQVHADTPFPGVSYACLDKGDKFTITVTVSYPENSPSLYETKTVKESCKLSAGTFRAETEYFAGSKCGLMNIFVTIFRGNDVVRKASFGDMCQATGDEAMIIVVNGKTGNTSVEVK